MNIDATSALVSDSENEYNSKVADFAGSLKQENNRLKLNQKLTLKKRVYALWLSVLRVRLPPFLLKQIMKTCNCEKNHVGGEKQFVVEELTVNKQ